MPQYSYECSGCDHSFVKIKTVSAMKAPTEDPCPSCGERGVKLTVKKSVEFVAGVNTKAGIPSGFKDVLNTIKSKAGKKCTIDV